MDVRKKKTQGEKIKTQGKNSKLKHKTQGYGKSNKIPCRKQRETCPKGGVNEVKWQIHTIY